MALNTISHRRRVGSRLPKSRVFIKNLTLKGDSNLQQILSENSSHFFQQTTFHGLKFVGDSQLSILERVFFGISFLVALVVCIIFMERVYRNWTLTPVLISRSPVLTPVDTVPFPAITICNMNQALASKVKFLKPNTTEYSILETFCNRKLQSDSSMNLNTKDWFTYKQFLYNISQSCQSMLLSCKFGSMNQNCSEIFKPTITDDGVCCNFNMVHTKFMYKEPELAMVQDFQMPKEYEPVYWSPEKEYPTSRPRLFYPQTVAATGVTMGLSIILKLDKEEYFCSSTNGYGFRVSIRNPVETHQVKEAGMFIKTGDETLINVSVQKMDADESIRDIDAKDRQCIFEDERNLTFFNIYTRMNCVNECEAQAIYADCQCIPVHMPRIVRNVSICGIQDYDCIQQAKLKTKVHIHASETSKLDCGENCSASCAELSFSTVAVSTRLGFGGKFTIQNDEIAKMTQEYIKDNIAVAHFFFRSNSFRGEIKKQFIGLTDFLSSTGGLMGLFLGFSFISIVELIYYITIRPFFSAKRLAKQLMAKKKITKVDKIHDKMNPFSKYYEQQLDDYMIKRY